MGILRAIFLGFVGFIAPRLAVALGMPLDQWIADFAAWASSTPGIINRDQAIWGTMLIVGLVGLSLELWLKPVGKMFGYIKRTQSEKPPISDQAGLIKQHRLWAKQNDLSRRQNSTTKPKLVIQHDKPRDTEPWSGGGGYNVKFRVLNDSNVRATSVGARIRTLEFLQEGEWRSYHHDYAEVPLSTRDGRPEFDLKGGDEESVYIARRSVKPGESIQLCYARAGIPNTIPIKPAWRVGIRLVSDNAPPKDAVFQLRVSKDGSLVGILLNDETEDELTRRRRRAEYISEIYAEAVDLRNEAASLRVLDASKEARMDELQQQLLDELRDLAPERSINLQTLNVYNPSNHPPMALKNPKRTLEFSEFLRRVMETLNDYR